MPPRQQKHKRGVGNKTKGGGPATHREAHSEGEGIQAGVVQGWRRAWQGRCRQWWSVGGDLPAHAAASSSHAGMRFKKGHAGAVPAGAQAGTSPSQQFQKRAMLGSYTRLAGGAAGWRVGGADCRWKQQRRFGGQEDKKGRQRERDCEGRGGCKVELGAGVLGQGQGQAQGSRPGLARARHKRVHSRQQGAALCKWRRVARAMPTRCARQVGRRREHAG